jgi:hypothetical protein
MWVDTPVAAAFANLATMLLQRSVLAPSRARVRELDDSDPFRQGHFGLRLSSRID